MDLNRYNEHSTGVWLSSRGAVGMWLSLEAASVVTIMKLVTAPAKF